MRPGYLTSCRPCSLNSNIRERENITIKFPAVILLLLQIIAHSVGLPDCTCVETFNSVEECVAAYWRKGYRYAPILIFLSVYHGIHWTLRQLKYFKKQKLGLRRRGNQSTRATVLFSVIRPPCFDALVGRWTAVSMAVGTIKRTRSTNAKNSLYCSNYHIFGPTVSLNNGLLVLTSLGHPCICFTQRK